MDQTNQVDRMDQKEREARDAAFLEFQRSEVEGAALYSILAKAVKNQRDGEVLHEIARDEAKHARIFESYTERTVHPRRFLLWLYVILSKVLGYTFCIKFFERNEAEVDSRYADSRWQVPELGAIMEDEQRHEALLISMLNEERVRYTGSIVLGLNDALVELTGALAGYTLAMQNTHLIAMAGLITGVSATLSMAASGFLSARADGRDDALKSAVYTGFAYLMTVFLLILPYLFLNRDGYMAALAATLTTAVGIIAVFNAYTSVVLDRSFKQSFFEMAGLSLGVAAISFVVGIVVKQVLGIDL